MVFDERNSEKSVAWRLKLTPGGHFQNRRYTFYFSFLHEKKQYNPLFRVPTGHSGALTSIHRFRVPTGFSGDLTSIFMMKWMQSTVLECLPKAHEKIVVLSVY